MFNTESIDIQLYAWIYGVDGDSKPKQINDQSYHSEVEEEPNSKDLLQFPLDCGQINKNQQDQNEESQIESVSKLYYIKQIHGDQGEKYELRGQEQISTQINVAKVCSNKKCTIQETKNLPGYYIRAIRRYGKKQKSSLYRNLTKGNTKKQLRKLLSNEDVRELTIKYLTSFQFLDDLLTSDKQQDIAPPIKYLNKVYQECVQPNSLYNWKD